VDAYRSALALDPRMPDVWFALGSAQMARGAAVESVRSFRRAVAQRADWPRAHLELARALFKLGEIDRALGFARRAAAATEDSELRRAAVRFIAVVIPGSPKADHGAILEARRAFASLERARALAPREPGRHPEARPGKIRVGYVSAFFGSRNWMKPVWGVVNHHDRTAFELHLFADDAPPSAESGYRPDGQDVVHDVTRLSNEGLARRIARAGIDVLVDLNGYSAPARLAVFMRRPSPVIVGWFNSYGSSGIDAFDYIVGDAAVVLPGEERFYSERVLRVPGSYLAFSVPYRCPPVAPPPCLERSRVTFGSFCSQYKITSEVIAAWATILRAAPRTELLLKNRALDDTATRSLILRRFAREGVERSRVRLEGSAEHDAFLAAYARVDIALDAFPYSGGTTTMEALWQGVPVLTHDGDRWASRTSRSLLLAAGLDDWCATGVPTYVARAVSLARSRETPRRLASLRSTLRERLRDSPACDSAGLARSLEDLYRRIVVRTAGRRKA
jgi:predicted O-linked N-acetylglucosamine transferase (SPINDLY family)